MQKCPYAPQARKMTCPMDIQQRQTNFSFNPYAKQILKQCYDNQMKHQHEGANFLEKVVEMDQVDNIQSQISEYQKSNQQNLAQLYKLHPENMQGQCPVKQIIKDHEKDQINRIIAICQQGMKLGKRAQNEEDYQDQKPESSISTSEIVEKPTARSEVKQCPFQENKKRTLKYDEKQKFCQSLGNRMIEANLSQQEEVEESATLQNQELDTYLKQINEFRRQGLSPLQYRLRSFQYMQLDVFQVTNTKGVISSSQISYPSPLSADLRMAMLENSKKQEPIQIKPELQKIIEQHYNEQLDLRELKYQSVHAHRHIMPATKKGDVAADDISKCPFFKKMAQKKPFDTPKETAPAEAENVGSKRIMTDQIFKTLLRSFRSFFRKLLVSYNNTFQHPSQCIGKLFIQDLGIENLIDMTDHALQFIILPINHPLVQSNSSNNELYISIFDKQNNRVMRDQFFENTTIQSLWQIFAMSNCLMLILNSIEQKYGEDAWARFNQERIRIYKNQKFDIFSGFKE